MRRTEGPESTRMITSSGANDATASDQNALHEENTVAAEKIAHSGRYKET
jgi:hypothetical protein